MSNEMYPIGCDPVHFEQSLTVLLTRLEKLFLYLREKAHNVEKNYLLLINHLLNPGFLFHEEPLVKIMVACCLAQLFHLFPESIIQFDDEDLMNIFTFYIQLLQYLGTVDKVGLPFFKALMKTLNKTDVFVELFKSLKSVENKNSIYDNVMLVICKGVCERENVLRLEQHILIFLHTFINGTKHNSEKGIAVILKCLLNENAIKHPIMNQLAGKVMQKCESTLYFPVRMLLYKGLDQEMECEIPEAIDGHEFELMYELHYVCPNILVGLWNQLELLISEPDSHSKKKPALILLAHMFSDKNSDFAKKYRCLWFKFKKCVQGQSSFGRSILIKNASNFLRYHPELQSDIVHMLINCAKDSEATIRFGVIRAISKATKYNLEIVEDRVLLEILENLILDTNKVVHKEAITTLGLIYRRIMDSEHNMVSVTKWLVNKLMHLFKTPYDFNDLMAVIEKVIVKCLVPYELPHDERMIKLLQLWCLFDEESSRNFHWCLQLKKRALILTCDLLSSYKELPVKNISFINWNRENIAGKLSLTMGYKLDLHTSLCLLTKELITNKRLYNFLEKYVEEGNCAEDFEKLWIDNQEILSYRSHSKARSLRKEKQLTSSDSLVLAVKQLCSKIGDFLMDEQSIKQLQQLVIACVNNDTVIKQLTVDQESAVKQGIELLYVYYSCKPQWGFQDLSIIKELNFLSGHHSQCVLKIFCTLSSYKPLGEKFPDFVNGTLVPYWKDLIITGIPKEVKYAVRCICSHIRERDESLLVGVLEEFVASMSGSELYLAGLISLGYFGTYLSDKFSKSWLLKLFNVSKNALDKLIFQDSESLTPDDDPWHQKTDLPYDIRCKVEALKAITRFVIRLNNKSLTNTVMDVLKKIIQGNGAYSETDKLTVSAKAWLRLTCGCCFLKLCDAKRIYDHIPRKAFFQMAKLMKDESPVVRRRFVTKLSKKLRQWKKQKFGLPSVFISYFALCALEKNYTLKSEMENELNQCVQDKRHQAWYIYQIGKLYTGISQMHHQLPQVFPDFCVHVAVELLALLVYDTIDSIKSVEQVYSCLEFLFKALFETKNRIFVHFSTDYFSGVFDNIRECKNIVEPENDVLNKKMWAVCEIGKFFLSTVPFKLNNKAISPASRVDPSYILYCSIDNTNIKHLPKNVDKYLMESLIKRKVIVGAKTKVLLDEEETEYEESTSDEEQVAVLYPDRGEIEIQKQSTNKRIIQGTSPGTGSTTHGSSEEQTPKKKARQQVSRLQKLKNKRNERAHKK